MLEKTTLLKLSYTNTNEVPLIKLSEIAEIQYF